MANGTQSAQGNAFTSGMASTPAGGASSTDINSTLKNIVSNIGQEAMAVGALVTAIYSTFPRISGQFTLSANASPNGTTFVTQPAIHANGFPLWTPTSADADLAITNGLFLQGVTAGSGFVIFAHGSTIGDETFSYIVFNP